jgi:eukaryotic-like serine/threonine-protein kinase
MYTAAPDAENLAGRQIEGYLVLRRIGSGGMADVYLAEQKSLGRQVALKVLHARLAHEPIFVERFHNEARAAAALVHPNIVQIYEVGEADGIHYIAQEFVAGKGLDEILSRQGMLDEGMVLDILRQVTSALSKAAEVGIVHRDIKPANILFSTSGVLKVADFGLARVLSADSKTLTQVGVAMGTPLYMSPEQIEGRPVDARSDIYSLGITAYHLLAGEPPHLADTALAIAVQHLNREPESLARVRPGLNEKLVAMVHRMMAKQPANRYAGPAELMVELKELSKTAAEEGWAAGPDQWSLVEWIAADGSRGAASAELEKLLREQSQLEPKFTRRRATVLLILAALVGGALLGWRLQPRFLLRGAQATSIPKGESPAAQLFHAKMVDSEAGWRAVEQYFPQADAFLKRLAQQGLVRHYLIVTKDGDGYEKALHVLHGLSEQTGDDESLRAFVLAAEYICHERLGHDREAEQAYSQLSTPLRDQLAANERQLFDLLGFSQPQR